MVRPRKPTAVKRLQGTLQKCRTNPDEPLPENSLLQVKAPSFFNKEQKALWKYALSQMPEGLLTSLDIGVFSRWCVLYEQFISMSKILNETGSVLYDESGNPYPNPVLNALNKITANLRGIETEIGFTPASRSKISVPSKENNSNKFLEL